MENIFMANRDYIIFDWETGSRNPNKTQPTQIAALALDGRNLKLKGQFNSEIKPVLDDEKAISLGLDPIEDEALKITHKTREQLENAPTLKVVWNKFIKFVGQYNWKNDPFYAPIPVGFNILGFDMIIIDRLCREYGPWDKDREKQKLFSRVYKFDIMDNIFAWTEGDPSIKSISMDSLRDIMGLSKENAHDALQDVKDEANIFIKLMKTHRAVYQNMNFEKAFANKELYVK
ncbi:3'-5' exonuclease [bacterium]|nr:3'-5' exonuclease [bacterium]